MYENSKKQYVKIINSGKYYNNSGRVVDGKSSEAHIPLEDFDFRRIPWK